MNFVVLVLLAVAFIYFVKGVFSGKNSDFFYMAYYEFAARDCGNSF